MKHKVDKKTDKLAVELFGRNASDSVEKGACVSCAIQVLVSRFLTKEEEEEYRSTGLCLGCEDELMSEYYHIPSKAKVYALKPSNTSYTQLPLKEVESLAIRRKKKSRLTKALDTIEKL